MAVAQDSFTGNGSLTNYDFTFPYLKQSEIKASLDGTPTTNFRFLTATRIQFVNNTTANTPTAPASGVKIKIYRETETSSLAATFYAGSSIKSQDLNDNFTQNLYATQEVAERYVSNLGGTMTGDLNLGEDVVIKFEGATDNAHETTLTVTDPTADRTITLPNVTGTVVTTGDTGTVATGMIAADAINGTKIADDSINSEHYVDGSIDTAHIGDLQVNTDKLASNAVTTIKILDANVTTAKIANDAVDATKLANTSVSAGTYTAADITVDAQGRLTAAASGTIAGSEIAADAIDGTKIADNAINSEHYTDGSIDREHLAADIIDGSKIADDSLNSEHYVDGSIDTAHIANDAVDATKLANTSVTAGSYTATDLTVDAQGRITAASSGTIGTSEIAADAIDATKIADNAVTTDHIQDAELTTLAGMQSGTASILASSTALTSTTTELNQLDGKTLGETTLTTNSDTAIPTSKAVNDRILTVTNALGGFVAIANETSFPATHPDPSDGAGTVVSVSDAGGVVVNGSGVASITNGAGSGNTVTINGFPSSLYSKTLAAGVGLQVQTTGTLHTYDYHKILAKEADVEQLSGDINDFNERYRIASSEPGSNNDEGDLYFDTSANKMKVYNGSAWDDVASVGNFYINTISSSSGTGGGSATFNGSAYRFTLSNPPTMAQQLIVSVNGVIQKPNAGSSQPSEGFAISGNDIIFSAAPASGADYFIVTQGSSVSIGTPSDNTVSTAKLQNLAVATGKIADDAVTADKLANSINTEIAANTAKTSNATHTGEVTGATALTITDDVVDEANLKISNAGTDGQFLSKQSGNTGGLTWATVEAAPVIAANADGSISANDAVVMQSDGTVKKIEQITTAANHSYSNTVGLNSQVSEHYSVAADPHNSNRWAVVYRDDDGSPNNGKIKIITRSGTSLTESSWHTFATNAAVPTLCFDPAASGRIVVFYKDGDNSNNLYARLVTFTGSAGSESFTNNTALEVTNHNGVGFVIQQGFTNPQPVGTSGNFLFVWHYLTGGEGYIQAKMVNLSGTTLATVDGAHNDLKTLHQNTVEMAGWGVNPSGTQGFIAFRNQNGKFAVKPFTLAGDGTTMTITPVGGTTDAGEVLLTDNISSDNQHISLAYVNDTHFVVIAKGGSANGYQIESFLIKYVGTSYTKSSAVHVPTNLTGTPGSENQSMYGTLSNNRTTDPYKIALFSSWSGSGTSSGYNGVAISNIATVDLDNMTISWSNQARIDDCSNSTEWFYIAQQSGADQAVLLIYRDEGDDYMDGRLYLTGSVVSNLSTSFIGFSSAAYTNGQSATINVIGNTTTKSSLTPGTDYYVQKTGALATTAADPSVRAGIALSSTKLLIKG